MPLKELLFSSKGRIPRSTWWYYGLAVAGVELALWVLAIIILALVGNSNLGDAAALMGVILCITIPLELFVFVTTMMVNIKRCHDRNRSGWFLLWSYIPSIMYSIFSQLFVMPVSISYGYDPSSTAGFALVLNCILSAVTFGLGLWVLIELGFLKGTAGPNQYGPDPTMPNIMQGYQIPGQPGYGQAGYNQPGPAPLGYNQPGVPPEVKPAGTGIPYGRIKACLHCGEAIEMEAAYCKFCGRAQS